MTTDQTPAQRMAEIEADMTRTEAVMGNVRSELLVDMRYLFDRCRKLEKVAEEARGCFLFERDMPDDVDRGEQLERFTDALKGAGYDD